MSGERTEEPTPKKLDEARAKGDVARSRDLVSFASLAVALVLCAGTAETATGRLLALLRATIVGVGARSLPSPAELLLRAVTTVAILVVPIVLGMMVVGTLVSLLDSGPVFAPGRLMPKLERLDPVNGAKQLFGKERLVELGKSLFALVALTVVATIFLRELVPELPRLVRHSPADVLSVSGTVVGTLVRRILVVLAALAVIDVFLSRRQFLAGMRMTKDEVKREYKEADGDPHQKAERSRLHREVLEHAVLENVRRADVLVVNPTHLAVALRFDEASEQAAPEVVGKGEDSLAQKMIEVARESGVPVMRDIPLARSLYELDLGDEIPEELFEAVAAVLRAAWDEREGGG